MSSQVLGHHQGQVKLLILISKNIKAIWKQAKKSY